MPLATAKHQEIQQEIPVGILAVLLVGTVVQVVFLVKFYKEINRLKEMKNKLQRVYHGNSMKGTFRKGDFLIIEPWTIENLRKGDIIAYRDKREGLENSLTVHRIILIDKGYSFTRGDNNIRPDIIPVSGDNLIGKVISYERNGKSYPVIGGLTGLIRARIFYFFRRSCYWLFSKIRRLLPTKVISNMLNKLWKSRIQKIKLHTKDGPIIKWVFRNRTIAHWFPENRLQKTSFLSHFLINSKNQN